MSDWAILSIILFIVIVILSYLLYRESKEKSYYQDEANKKVALISALEHLCNYPSLSSEELDVIEPYLGKISRECKTIEEYLQKSREAIIALYKSKQK